MRTVVVNTPVEECSLQPVKTCTYLTKLVPVLQPKEKCNDVPKEVCAKVKKNPKQVQKPVVKKRCKIPNR